MLRLGLLGPPSVDRDGAPAASDTRKSVALLALLAVGRRPQSRDAVAAMLWPESDDARARSSLRRTLSVTAAAVGPALVVTRASLSVDQERTWCDLWEFERLAANDDAGSLAEAAALYRDDFLRGFHARAGAEFDHWSELVAEEQRQRLSRVLERLVATASSNGELETALAHARRWIGLDELHEPAHRAMMQVLAWSGQRAAALEQYRRCVGILDRELGVEPLAETTELYEEILADHLAPPGGVPAAPRSRGEPHSAGAAMTLASQGEVVGALEEELGRVSGVGRVALLRGPTGSGKTHILDAFRRRNVGTPWIAARCHEAERTLELGCVTELLRSSFALRPDLGAALSEHDRREVGRLVPDLAGAGHEQGALESPGAQVRFFRAVGAALGKALAGPRPGVVAVEDVHHVDDTSARLLGYLVRRLDDLAGLVVLTWQPDRGLPAALEQAVSDAGARVSSHRAPLLGPSDVAAILAARGATGVAPDAFAAVTGGMALLVFAYADAFAAVDGGPQARWDVPPTARQLFADRLASVSQATAQVLSSAAVLGSAFDAALLRETSGRSPSEVADALDEAIDRGLVVEQVTGTAHAYDFSYDGLRHVAYDTCGSARRRLLHGRAADALGRRPDASGPGAAAVAAHLERAGRREEAAGWSWRAAERSVALFAHAEALANLRQALDLGHEPVKAHRAISDALVALGRYREAAAELEKAAAAAIPGDDATAAGTEHRLAAVQERLGNWSAAAAHIDAASGLARDEPVLRARIEADRALVAYRLRDPEAALIAGRALEEASAVDDPQALAQATNVAGMLAAEAGDPARAEELLRRSLKVAGRLEAPAATVAALNNLSQVLYSSGRLEEALDVGRRALEHGIEHGDVHRVAALHSNLADLLHAAGRREEAIGHLKESATGFAAVDTGDEVSPGIWTLTRW